MQGPVVSCVCQPDSLGLGRRRTEPEPQKRGLASYISWRAHSILKLQPHFDDAWRGGPCDPAECATAEVTIRIIEVRMVKEIERFEPKLKTPLFRDGKLLQYSGVEVVKLRPSQN